MRRWFFVVLVVGGVLTFLVLGLNSEANSPVSSTTPSTTTTAPPSTTTTVSTRPAEAVAAGTEKAVNRIPGLHNLHLDPIDALVIIAIVAAITALILLRPRGLGPVAVSATEVRTDGDGMTTETPRSDIAVIVTDRLARVDLHPPSAVPSVAEDVEGVLSPFDSTPAKAAQAATRLAEMLRREKGFRLKLLLRTSDTTTRRGATFELVDLSRAAGAHRRNGIRRHLPGSGSPGRVLYRGRAAPPAPPPPGPWALARVGPERRLVARLRRRWLVDQAEALRPGHHPAARRTEGRSGEPSHPSASRHHVGAGRRPSRGALDLLPRRQPQFPARPGACSHAEAALCRWRTAVVLSNGHRWGPAWLRDALTPGTRGVHTIDKRLRAFLEDRFKTALLPEYTTICKTVLADHIEQNDALRRGAPHLPQLQVVQRWRGGRLRLVGDDGPGQTLEAIVNKLGVLAEHSQALGTIAVEARSVLESSTRIDGRVERMCHLLEEALAKVGASADRAVLDAAEALALALPAVSVRHFLWRCAEYEAGSLTWRQRRAGRISRGDVKTLRIGMEQRASSGLRPLPVDWRIASLARVHRRAVERQAREEAAWPAFRLGGQLGPRRAQLAYNLACSLAIALPSRGDSSLADWQRATHDRVDAIVMYLHRATTGPGNLVEQGALEWIVYEDPDLQELRQHARFCRWAAGVLQREVVTEAPSESASIRYVRSLLDCSAGATRQSWAPAEKLDRSRALELLRKEKELCARLADVLEAPNSPESRARAFEVAFGPRSVSR